MFADWRYGIYIPRILCTNMDKFRYPVIEKDVIKKYNR